jgi:hypothetical protein
MKTPLVVPVILLIITNVLVAFTPDTQVNWQSCSSFPKGQLSTKNTANSISCAAIEVPLLWNNSSDPRSIDFFVEKIECANQENRKVRNKCFSSIECSLFDEIMILNLCAPIGSIMDIKW